MNRKSASEKKYSLWICDRFHLFEKNYHFCQYNDNSLQNDEHGAKNPFPRNRMKR